MAKQIRDFEKMDFLELVALRDEIERVVSRRVVAERKSLESRIAALSAIAHTSSVPAASRLNGSRRRNGKTGSPAHPLKGRTAAPKFRGPKGETWAGRGLAPRWLVALEKKGRKREQFLIARPS